MKLVQVTKDNLREVVNLKLDETQIGFVSDNVLSMAQAAVNPDYQPRAVVVKGQIVGFLMYSEWLNADWAPVPRPNEYYIFRVMTDRNHQGKGYGRLMMNKVLEEIRAKNPKAIHIGYSESNQVARNFYQSLGFVEYGHFNWGDVAAKIEFK
ncbi:GNAT family N-acetyltransferase [Vibrio breoganii]